MIESARVLLALQNRDKPSNGELLCDNALGETLAGIEQDRGDDAAILSDRD